MKYSQGKGEMKTYWLINEDPAVRQRRLLALDMSRGPITIEPEQYYS